MRHPVLGVSVAGYRSEGGFNGPGEPANQWAAWERSGMAPPGWGADLWRDPARMLDLASASGAQVLALSVEWAKIEPAPDRLDDAALERYAGIVEACAARGITPLVVLHDVAHPEWLGEEFWLTPGSPDRFARHAERVARRLRGACGHWLTFRQANVVAWSGWVVGSHPPRRWGALSDAWAVMDNLLTAHLLTGEVLREVQPAAVVALGLGATGSYDWGAGCVDLLRAPFVGVERRALDAWLSERRAGHDAALPPQDLGELASRRLLAASSPFGSRGPWGGAARLRRPSPRRCVDAAYAQGRAGRDGARRTPLDALVLRWPPHAIGAGAVLGAAGRGTGGGRRSPWDGPPDPVGLAAWCRHHARTSSEVALWIEDGFATRRGAPRRDGWDRPAYLRADLSAVTSAAGAGVPIDGYLYCCLVGGADPAWPDADFGLYSATGEDQGASAYRALAEERHTTSGAPSGAPSAGGAAAPPG